MDLYTEATALAAQLCAVEHPPACKLVQDPDGNWDMICTAPVRSPRTITQDDDGVWGLEGDWIASRSLEHIIKRLREMIADREDKPLLRQTQTASWNVNRPANRAKRGKSAVKPAPKPPQMRSAQIALSLSMSQIIAMFVVGSKWKATDTSTSIHCGIFTLTKAMPKTMVLLNQYSEWKISYPSEVFITNARPGYLSWNIADGEMITLERIQDAEQLSLGAVD
jgi:hypothetical protein